MEGVSGVMRRACKMEACQAEGVGNIGHVMARGGDVSESDSGRVT